MRLSTAIAVVCLSTIGLSAADEVEASVRQPTDIPVQALALALQQLASERDVQLVYRSEIVGDRQSGRATGVLTFEEALNQTLSGTGLTYQYLADEAITIVPVHFESSDPQGTQAGARKLESMGRPDSKSPPQESSYSLEDEEPGSKGIPEILVIGSRILNTDIRRSRDDTQPYVIFDRSKLESSGAANLESFLRDRLTANTSAAPKAQGALAGFANQSEINLRGLGAGQTLILIDGRRLSGVNNFGTPAQGDIRGIPISAVERIEVLPTTAGGVYGGGATGGVINIILRRDYEGAEVKVTFDNTFDSDSANKRIDLAAGFSLEDGKTRVLLGGSFAEANPLTFGARDFIQRGRAMILANRGNDYQVAFNSGAFPILGATPNIRSADGSNLVLKDGTPLNSPITYIPNGYHSTQTDGGAALVANAGKYNLGLAESAQFLGGRDAYLLWTPQSKSLMATLRHELTSHVQVFLDGAYSNVHTKNKLTTPIIVARARGAFTLPASAPNNPFQQTINLAVPSESVDERSSMWSNTRARRLIGGVIVQLPHKWQGEVDYAWGESLFDFAVGASSISTQLNPLTTTGVIDIMRDTRVYPVDFAPFLGPRSNYGGFRTTQKDVTARFSGPVFTLPAGPIVVSTLLEHREQVFNQGNQGATIYPTRSQSVDSAYLEARIPLVSGLNALPGVRELEVQIAGRHDRYEINGVTSRVTGPADPVARNQVDSGATHPTVGLRYQPLQDLVFRASYGTGFLPPTVNQILPILGSTAVFTVVTDPRRGNESVTLTTEQYLSGGNPDLQPEESESFSAGLILTPRFLPGLRLSADYTQIKKTNNISTFPSGNQALVNNEDLFPDRIQRAAPVPGDPYSVGRIVGLNATLLNMAAAEVETYDVQLDYNFETANAGAFSFYALATWQTHYRTQVLVTQPFVENVGVTSRNPLKFKANAGVNWTRSALTVGWTARHFDSYRLINPIQLLNQGGKPIPQQTYHNMFVQYRIGADRKRSGWTQLLADTEIQLGINNVFNKVPPVDASNAAYGFYSLYGDPRLRTYSLSLKKTF